MKDGASQLAKKSLISSLESLEKTSYDLFDLATRSDFILDKLYDPRPGPKTEASDCKSAVNCANEPIPDLIDLFNKSIDKIRLSMSRIEINMEKINSFIE